MSGPPVVITTSLGRPVTNVFSERGAVPMVVVSTLGEPVTLVASGGEPVTLLNPNGTLWDFPFSLFSSGAQGAWYDPSDFSTLFQNAAGSTPVTAVEQPVRLMLDRSRGLVQTTILSDTFAYADTAAMIAAGWSAAGYTGSVDVADNSLLSLVSGAMRVTAAASRQFPRSSRAITGLTSGRSYIVYCDITPVVGTSWFVSAGTSSTGSGSTGPNGTGAQTAYPFLFQATATTMYVSFGVFSATIGHSTDFDNISVRELPGNHATAPNDASRPVLRARYNLLTYSEQFDNAAWTKTSATVTANAITAPDGTTTADEIEITGNDDINQTITVVAGATITASVYLKKSTFDWVRLRYEQDTGANQVRVWANLATGTIGTSSVTDSATLINANLTSVGNGWYRLSVTGIASTATSVRININSATADNVTTRVAAGNKYFAWGADLKTAADQTSTGGAYQRIAAATSYDTSNPVFRPYLAFDGSDDSFSTSSIDFSGTDEMTLFAGVTKNTDTSFPVIVELGNRATIVNGSFTVHSSSSSTPRYLIALCGTSITAFEPETYTAPITNVIAASLDIAGAARVDEVVPRINGVLNQTNPEESSTAGTGNFGNLPLFIGRRNNTSNPFNGRIYSLAVLGRTATAAEISAMEAWVAGKTGVTL
jgi:hypothetical protein